MVFFGIRRIKSRLGYSDCYRQAAVTHSGSISYYDGSESFELKTADIYRILAYGEADLPPLCSSGSLCYRDFSISIQPELLTYTYTTEVEVPLQIGI